MKQAIDGGGWFDLNKAHHYKEDTVFDGQNHISLATGSQWDHEELYRTAKGTYVRKKWSQWQGSADSWEVMPAEEAADWLIKNNHELPADLEEYAVSLEV